MAEKDNMHDSTSDMGMDDGPGDDFDDDGGGEGAPAWMATYGDLVTLLFAFFVLLYAMSSVQQESFKELVKSLRSALGVQQVPEAGTREGLELPEQSAEEKPADETAQDAVDEVGGMVQKEIDDITTEVRELVMFNQLGGQVKVEGNETGATITISDIILFPAGHARMTDGGIAIMKKIFKILAQFSYHIKIAGHTDNIPIKTSIHASNWELSANRACEVVRLLIDEGIAPELLSAVGYAEFRPVATNDTPEGRAQNRRVEIIYERQAIAEKIASEF